MGHRLQETESGRIMPSQKKSGNRSCTFANNEIANNSSKIMMHLIFSKASNRTMTHIWVISVHVQSGIFFALRRLGWNLFYQFRPQRFLKMAYDQTGSVRDVCSRLLSQSIAIDQWFLCGY